MRFLFDAASDASGHPVALASDQAVSTIHVDRATVQRSAPQGIRRPAAPRAPQQTRDVFGSGKISANDIDMVRAAWYRTRDAAGSCHLAAENAAVDANGDGCIDVLDLQALLNDQGQTRPRPQIEVTGNTGASAAEPQLAAVAATAVGHTAAAAFNAPDRTFVVTATADTDDAVPGNGLCADSQGRCTLRAALTEASWQPGENLINFNLPGTAPVTIQLTSHLPNVGSTNSSVVIDGYSQPGSRVNTAEFGTNAIPGVEIRGSSAIRYGFYVPRGGNTIRGLLIDNTLRGVFVDTANGANNQIIGNFMGFNRDNSLPSRGNDGVLLNNGAHDNLIGTPALADRNVIGNYDKALFESGPGTDRNVIQNNVLCIRPDGQTASCATGIDHDFGPKDGLIGGTGADAGNVFGPTGLNGIEFSHGFNPAVGSPGGTDQTWQVSGNRVIGNWIGFRVDGSYAAAYRSATNTPGADNGQAVNIYDGSRYNVIDGNWIAAAFAGVTIANSNSTGNIVRNNIIGQSPKGEAAPMARWGIYVRWNTHTHTIEGNTISNATLGGIGLLEGNVDQIRMSRNIVTNTSGPAILLTTDSQGSANDKATPPVITQATTVGASGTGIAGSTVEVYRASRAAGESGLPAQFLASAVVASNGTWSTPIVVTQGTSVVALQIRADGNTSALGTNVSATFQAPPPPPTADFSWIQQSGNLKVNFTDTSTGSPTQWSWDFGDGTTSNQQSPTKTYAQSGQYTVSLTATNAGGSNKRTRTITVVPGSTVPPVAADGFNRTSANGWGNADVGGPYTIQGQAANFSVGAGVGSMVVPASGSIRSALLNSTSAQDVDVTFRVRTDKLPAAGNLFVYAVVRRHDGTDSEYRPRLLIGSNGSVSAHASVVVNGTEDDLGSPVVVPGLTLSANSWIRFRAQISGSNPTTIRVRAWADGQAEPSTWNYTITDTSAGLQNAGSVGLRVYVGRPATNAPMRFDFANYAVNAAATPPPPPPPPAGTIAADTFGRTTSSGWASADTGGLYTTQGGAAAFTVGSGAGSIVVPEAANTRSALLNSTSAQDVDISFRVRTDKLAVGGQLYVYAVARRQSGSDSEYRPRVMFMPNGDVRVQASVVINGVETDVGPAVTVPGLAYTANTWVWFHARVSGTGPTTIRVRAWADGQTEPSTWNFNATDNSAGVQAAGSFGLRVYASRLLTNAPIRFDFDDYAVTAYSP
jgi:CSLREA domain-containing protein